MISPHLETHLTQTTNLVGRPTSDEATPRVVPFFDPLRPERNVPPTHGRAKPASVALIGTFAPRKCGIATFTTDISEQLGKFCPEISLDVFAVDKACDALTYSGVTGVIDQDSIEHYRVAARRINEGGYDAIWLQHEYGIFGGPDGEMVFELIDRIAAPLVVTLHTVLLDPSERQRAILNRLIARASRVMVMSRHSRDNLIAHYDADPDVIAVIPHGAPDRPMGRQERFKAQFGVAGRKVLMTFGLLGPGKGLESVVEALPAIVARHPDVVYRIVGATHPNLVAKEGEAYRERLIDRAEALGVADHIRWDNRFLDQEELLDQLEACDIYLTPYPNLQQSTSGTLSYAVALGKAVVSTAYVHARELLADGIGRLIEPLCHEAISTAVIDLLDRPDALAAMQRRAYAAGRATIWPRFAEATAALVRATVAPDAPRDIPLLATPGVAGVRMMSDSTGMFQHSIGVIPDRRHGYCLDDNARALMLTNVAEGMSVAERLSLATVYASFIQHSWNNDRQRFRNFMNFDRTWCEDVGSEDSNGRALWALGHTVEFAADADLRRWARRLFDQVMPSLAEVDSPRSVAFAMLGSCAILRKDPKDAAARAEIARGAATLAHLLDAARRPDWAWFEAVLGYDNPRLSQALIEAGMILENRRYLDSGLESLAWIAAQQTSSTGLFRPIGSESFGRRYEYLPFDQQPLEAWAAIDAAAVAFRASGERSWLKHALAAYRWYLGKNDRGIALADIVTGRCRDGITPRGVNENCGAESILAFQLSHYAMLAFARLAPDEVGGAGIGHEERADRQRIGNP